MKGRSIAKAYARMFGYFWLPCPLCGQEFGGHEWKDIDGKCSTIPWPQEGPGMNKGICPDCTKAGKGYRAEYNTAPPGS